VIGQSVFIVIWKASSKLGAIGRSQTALAVCCMLVLIGHHPTPLTTCSKEERASYC
jgi:hypothetical protein